MNRYRIVLLLCLSASHTWAASDIDEEKLRSMDQKCEEARAVRLAPVRDRMARQCVQENRYLANPGQDCALEMSTYGNTFSGARGAAIRGQYYDLPECVAAADAWRKWEAARPWKK